MRKLPLLLLLTFPALTLAQGAKPAPAASEPAVPPSIHEKTAGMKHLDGLIPLDWDARTGKLYLEISGLGTDARSSDYIFATSLPFGTGSNDLGLDRGQVTEGRIVRFERSGPKVLLVRPNLAFRSSSSDPGRAARGHAVLRSVGAVGFHGRGRVSGRRSSRRCNRFLSARWARSS